MRSVADFSECRTLCKAQGQAVAACVSKPSEHPQRNRLCFEAPVCSLIGGKIGTVQPPECMPGNFYCFPNPEKESYVKTKLNVSIGDLKTVEDLGVYFEALYKFILAAAVLISVVMVMVGGFQYALGAGAPEQISKGKERIKNGIIGVTLLLMAVLIVQTVNPQLLKLQPPRLTLVRPVELGGKSCEDFLAAGHIVTTDAAEKVQASYKSVIDGQMKKKNVPGCGFSGEVGMGPKGEAVSEGTVCDYATCGDSSERCLGTGDSAKCVRCEAVTPNNDLGVKPSTQVCQKLQIGDLRASNGTVDQLRRCFYTQDPDALFLIPSLVGGSLAAFAAAPFPGTTIAAGVIAADQLQDVTTGTCSAIEYSCSNINTCEDYDRIDVKNFIRGDVADPLDDDLDEIDLWSDVTLKSICEEDPCGIGQKTGQRCVFDGGSDCETPN